MCEIEISVALLYCELILKGELFMKIEHIALWVNDLELMKEFYCNYFKTK